MPNPYSPVMQLPGEDEPLILGGEDPLSPFGRDYRRGTPWPRDDLREVGHGIDTLSGARLLRSLLGVEGPESPNSPLRDIGNLLDIAGGGRALRRTIGGGQDIIFDQAPVDAVRPSIPTRGGRPATISETRHHMENLIREENARRTERRGYREQELHIPGKWFTSL